jgi:hypothetical protein
MTQDLFTQELIQAVNDWQRGGDHRQKVRRGRRLKECAAALSAHFRACDQVCYRQEAHKQERVWQLLADNHLPETIAAWTTDLDVAKNLKGGVPPPGLHGVIFALVPPGGTVVVNLGTLYADPDFLAAVEASRSKIVGFHDGIGRWGGSQSEIVLEVGSLETATIYSYGGIFDDKISLAALLNREPTSHELATFRTLLRKAGRSPDDWWLTQNGTQAVLARIQPHLPRLRAKKAAVGAQNSP